MLDVKLVRNDSVVIVVSSLMTLMTDQVPSVHESESCDHVVVLLCGINITVHARKVLRCHLHKSIRFYVIIKRMRKQWIPGTLSPSSVPGFEARYVAKHQHCKVQVFMPPFCQSCHYNHTLNNSIFTKQLNWKLLPCSTQSRTVEYCRVKISAIKSSCHTSISVYKYTALLGELSCLAEVL